MNFLTLSLKLMVKLQIWSLWFKKNKKFSPIVLKIGIWFLSLEENHNFVSMVWQKLESSLYFKDYLWEIYQII